MNTVDGRAVARLDLAARRRVLGVYMRRCGQVRAVKLAGAGDGDLSQCIVCGEGDCRYCHTHTHTHTHTPLQRREVRTPFPYVVALEIIPQVVDLRDQPMRVSRRQRIVILARCGAL